MTININIGGNENISASTSVDHSTQNEPPIPTLMENDSTNLVEGDSMAAPSPISFSDQEDASESQGIPIPEGFDNTQELGHGTTPSPEEIDMSSHDHAAAGGTPQPVEIEEDKPKTTRKTTKKTTSRSATKKK